MKANSLLLRVYGEKNHGQWSLICLDFNLAAQGDTPEEAQAKLHSMIRSYIVDAIAEDGPDRDHASELLRRRAPLGFWVKYYLFSAISQLRGKNGNGGRLVGSDTIPMIPSGA